MNLTERLSEEARQGAEYGGHPEYELLVSEAATEIERLTAEVTSLKADKARMDYLEAEPMNQPGTLFRRNMRITRTAIDDFMAIDGVSGRQEQNDG